MGNISGGWQHLNRNSFQDSLNILVALEISFDLPFGFPINSIISLSVWRLIILNLTNLIATEPFSANRVQAKLLNYFMSNNKSNVIQSFHDYRDTACARQTKLKISNLCWWRGRVWQCVAVPVCCSARHSHVTVTCKTCWLRIARRYMCWQAEVSVLKLRADPDTVSRPLARRSLVTLQHCNTL